MARKSRTASTGLKATRKNLLAAIDAVIAQVQNNAKGTKADPEATKAYAEAAQALMNSELARQLLVGKDGV